MTMSKIEWKKSNIDYDELNKLTVQKLVRIENGKNSKLANGEFPDILKNNGLKTGYKHYKNKTGLFSMTKEEKLNAQINGGKSAGKLASERGTVIKAGKISAKSKNHINNKKLKCPYCKLEGAYPTMKRWHMDRCKFKK